MPKPGEKCTQGGIYQCTKCSEEAAIGIHNTFPPSNCGKTGAEWVLKIATNR